MAWDGEQNKRHGQASERGFFVGGGYFLSSILHNRSCFKGGETDTYRPVRYHLMLPRPSRGDILHMHYLEL